MATPLCSMIVPLIPMHSIGKPFPGHLYGECFDFTGPYRLNAIVKACQGKPADPIEEAPKS